MAETDLYALLESDRSASPDELKKAYRRLARQYHPDASPDDPVAEAKFKQISLAYEVLSDPERRANYDRHGFDPAQGGGAGQGAGGFGFEGGFGDIFEAFFGSMGGQPRGRRGPQSGGDGEVQLNLTLLDVAFGAQKDLTVNLPVRCGDCGGSGAAPNTSATQCPDCGGAGEVRRVRQSLLGQMMTTSPCMRCQGLGEILESPCPTCRGDGRVMESKTLVVEVPAGVDTGSTLRLTDRGPAGPRGGPAGSLFVHLRVEPDPRFERSGDDLHTEVHIGLAQAALGTDIEIETLDGTTEIILGPGTQNSHVARVKGEGVTHLRGRGRGDLYAHVVVDVPTELTERQRELFESLAAELGESVGNKEAPSSHEGLFSKIKSAFS